MPRVRKGGESMEVAAGDVGYWTAEGWTPEDVESLYSDVADASKAPSDTGILGTIGAGVESFASGATLGLTDVALGSLSTTNEREAIRARREANPTISTIANIVGGLAPALASPATALGRLPAGSIGRASAAGMEAGRLAGGLGGAGRAVAAAGAEGAIQGAGAYLADAAIADRDITAEGFSAALGTGLVLGGAFGGAAIGVEKGTIAARKMFSRAGAGKREAQAAYDEWNRTSTEAIEAQELATSAARRKLDDARILREQAELRKAEIEAKIAQDRAVAKDIAPSPDSTPTGLLDRSRIVENDTLSIVPASELQERGWYQMREAVFKNPQDANLRSSHMSRIDEIDDELMNGPVMKRQAPSRYEVATVGVLPDGKIVPMDAHSERRIANAIANDIPVRVSHQKIEYPDSAVLIPRGRVGDEAIARAKAEISAGRGLPGDTGPFTDAGLEVAARRYVAQRGTDFTDPSIAKLQGAMDEVDAARAALEEMKAKISKGAVADELGPFTPSGLEEAAKRELRRKAEGAIPSYDSLAKRVGKEGYVEQTVDAAELVQRGWYELPGRSSGQRLAGVRRMVDAGKAEPVSLNVSPTGKITVTDGRHRLKAATDAGLPIKVRWYKGAEPAPGDMLRGMAERAGIDSSLASPIAGTDLLEQQLRATLDQMGAGSTIQEIGIAKTARPMSPKQIEQMRGEALERAALASDPQIQRLEMERADDLARMMEPARKTTVEEIVEEVKAYDRYERASAKLADALGEDAPTTARKISDDLRAAEDAASENDIIRTAHAAESTASTATPKSTRLQAMADIAVAKAAERAAAIEAKAAKSALGDVRRSTSAAMPAVPESLPPSLAGEIIQEMPVIGPLTRLLMRSRTTAASASVFTGRIPATTTAKMAAFASTTKDKLFHAVDAALGVAQRAARESQRLTPAIVPALRKRAYDDGEPDAPSDAPMREVAGVRMREVAAVTPQQITSMVRAQLSDVADAALVEATVKHQVAKYAHLASHVPPMPPPDPFRSEPWQPSTAAAMQWSRRYAVANDPSIAFDMLESRSLTPEAADTLRVVYPSLFRAGQSRLLDQAAANTVKIPYAQRVQNSLLFDVPLHPSMSDDRRAVLRTAHEQSPKQDPQPQEPRQPSISGGAALTNIYQSPSDRRDMR